MYAFYDLAVSPATFDIVTFLVLAENERKKYGYDKMHVVIVPGPDGGFRQGSFDNYNQDPVEKKKHDYMGWRLRNILVPCCWIVPSCVGVTVSVSRVEVVDILNSANQDTFPSDYDVDTPRGNYLLSEILSSRTGISDLNIIKPPMQASQFVDDWIQTHVGKKKIISITLRECSYEYKRNSNLEAWGHFARYLNPDEYYPVIIRDTESAFKPIPVSLKGINIFSPAAWNLEIRVAFYRKAYLNMFISNGPGAIALYDRNIRFLKFKIITQSVAATSADHLKMLGLEPGTQLPWLNQFQRWVWEDDDFDVLVREFEKMETKIKASETNKQGTDSIIAEQKGKGKNTPRPTRESFIIGSGKSLLALTKNEVSHINNADVSISINKYLLFYELAGIIPKYHIQFDANDEPSQRVFLRTLEKIKRDEKLHKVVLVFGEQLGKYAQEQDLPNPIIISSLHPLMGDGWNPELDEIGWSRSIEKNLFHFKGTLTSAINFAHALQPLNRIKLVGADMNSNEYFFQDIYEEDETLHDWTYELMKKSGKHSNILEEVGGYKQDYCIPWIEKHVTRTGGEIYICNQEAHYAKAGLLPYSEICDLEPPILEKSSKLANSPTYQAKLNQEIAIYEHNTDVHNLPAIHHVYAQEFLHPHLTSLTTQGDSSSWWILEIDELAARSDHQLTIVSLACGNGDTEMALLKKLAEPEKVQIIGMDVNPQMIKRAQAKAKEDGLPNALFEVQDLNDPQIDHKIDVVLANHSLHHLVELEKLFEHIAERSNDNMIFLINDMIGRNGHVMWPNAHVVVKEIWRRLDQRFKLNDYSKRYDLQPLNHDCSQDGFEGIRAQDILPALISVFDIEMFFPFATLINRFVDRSYGNNFIAEDAHDRQLILDILALDVELLKAKKLAPTQAFIRAQKKGTVAEPRILFQTPEEAISSRGYQIQLKDYYHAIDTFLPHLPNPEAEIKIAQEGDIPLVSVVIPVFNNLQYTHNCIKSILKYTRYSNYEVIVVDNASTDGTGQYLSNLNYENFKIVSNQENLGFVGGCNAGALAAEGEYIFFLNNDTEVRPFWLAAVVELMQARPDCGAIGSKLIYPDGELQEAGGIIFSDGDGWNVGRGMDPRDPRFNYVHEVDYCSGAALTIRKDLWKLIGGFDQRYSPAYYEDTDLCFSVREQGYKVLYHPLSSITHFEGKTAGTDLTSGFKKYQAINRVKFIEKWKHELIDQYEHLPENVIQASERANKINILIADPQIPMWDKASGSLRLFQTIEILAAANFHVVFICRNSNPSDLKYIVKLISLGVEVYPQDVEALKKIKVPYSTDKIEPINYELLFKEKQFKYAILSFWEIAAHYTPIIRKLSPQTRIIVDTVDVHFIRELREAELNGGKNLYKQALARKKVEISTYRAADELWVVTAEDQIELEKVKLTQPIHILPNIHKRIEHRKSFEKTQDLLFVGNFNHTPNRDAVLYFCDEIFPRIKKQVPEVRLYVVGNNPPLEILDLAQDNIVVTGFVEDISPYLLHARVSVNPLRYGAGMKGKVGEALSWGLPVVTTFIGAEGMHLEHGKHCLVADKATDFANEVVKVYTDSSLWQKLSDSGRHLVEENWSPEATKRILQTVLDLEDTPQQPVVSIIMLTWNALDYTKKCVKSISEHTRLSYEIIFVDNASKDGTQKYLEQLVEKHSHYKLIKNAENKGFAAGNNQGVELASGKYVLLLNNDVLVADRWLENLVEAIELDEHIGMLGPITNHISGRQMLTEVPYKSDQGYYEFADKVAVQNNNKITPRRRIAGFAILMKTELYKTVGGLDESYGSGNFEDDDLCLKVRAEGYAILVHEGVFIHHYGSQTFKANKLDYSASLKSKGKVFKQMWPNVNYDELIEVSNPLSDTHPALYKQGMTLLENGDYEDAYQHMLQIVEEDPLNEEALLGLSMAARMGGQKDQAVSGISRLLKLNPDNALAYNLSGLIAAEGGNLDHAKELFSKAIEKDGELLDARRNYAEILLMTGEFQEGIQYLMDIIAQYPDDIMTLLRLASLNIEAGHLEEALTLAKKVLEIDPGQEQAQMLIEGVENSDV